MTHRLRLAVIAILAFLTTACPVTSPALADPAPPPKAHTPPAPKTPEKIERMRADEEPVMVPNAFDPELKYQPISPDDPDYLKDPYVWA